MPSLVLEQIRRRTTARMSFRRESCVPISSQSGQPSRISRQARMDTRADGRLAGMKPVRGADEVSARNSRQKGSRQIRVHRTQHFRSNSLILSARIIRLIKIISSILRAYVVFNELSSGFVPSDSFRGEKEEMHDDVWFSRLCWHRVDVAAVARWPLAGKCSEETVSTWNARWRGVRRNFRFCIIRLAACSLR
jgi:hypothetical protein